MTDSKNPRTPFENICEFQEDAALPMEESRVRAVVEQMVSSCENENTVDHVGAALIPSKDEIIRILTILQDIPLPRLFRSARAFPTRHSNTIWATK